MTDRITNKMLESKIEQINNLSGFEGKSLWSLIDGNNVATVGMFYLGSEYSGVGLWVMVEEGGGIHDLTGTVSKRELWHYLKGYIQGLSEERFKRGK